MKYMKNIVEYLIKNNKTISTMESCTGGFIASSITNIEGSSDIFNFGAITYSNLYKIKMGVDKDLIEKYSVYSKEVAMDMAKKISLYTNSSYGIGVTGKINKVDKNNLYGKDNEVFISIYDKENDKFFNKNIRIKYEKRIENKEYILSEVEDMFNLIMI